MARTELLQVAEGLSPAQHRATFKRIQREGFAGAEFTIFGGAHGPTWDAQTRHDLGFLEHYAGIKSVSIFLPLVTSLEPVAALRGLKSLSLGEQRDRTISVAPIAQCTGLTSLNLVRTERDLDRLAELRGLRQLGLTGIPGKKLGWTSGFTALQHLYVAFTALDELSFLARFPKLLTLSLVRISKLSKLDAVEKLSALQLLNLDTLRQVTRLPRLDRLTALRVLAVMTLKGLKDVSGLKGSSIEELALIDVPLTARQLPELRGLKRAVVSLTSAKETDTAEAALGKKCVPSTNELVRYTKWELAGRL